jgi:addiction module HigA family antidote
VDAASLEQSSKRQGGISAEMVVRLSKAFGSSPEVWLGMQMEYDLAKVEKEAQNM